MNRINNDGYSLYNERQGAENVDRNYGHMTSKERTDRYTQITSHLSEVSGDCLMTTIVYTQYSSSSQFSSARRTQLEACIAHL
jgi:hypothetical protein